MRAQKVSDAAQREGVCVDVVDLDIVLVGAELNLGWEGGGGGEGGVGRLCLVVFDWWHVGLLG